MYFGVSLMQGIISVYFYPVQWLNPFTVIGSCLEDRIRIILHLKFCGIRGMIGRNTSAFAT